MFCQFHYILPVAINHPVSVESRRQARVTRFLQQSSDKWMTGPLLEKLM
ncbi:hypothetical protein SARI_02221 [Salmonella enterica subsp. arizonae serovar 62:z4,z23:-]|uniref:Uncharacterized protein n=1 Tax=Salmonella arizonae (strain ATCC BAA-731 / CDC346-86 / RSK2980) TaxID=41514 RepID=A9MJM9_SALAR|nr:hypothetical protein SARI_02221 [Salmonella enterica subsp. arizonae serovar 62:z4,z23:-]